ncbi:hypothetical protein HK101_005577 [Irineochytrium annulatum]|nr:hypothetical protein HK101_005577 [Irineochytrium annulatum]
MIVYATLGVSNSATTKEIKRAYKDKVLQHHPDRLPLTASAREKEDVTRRFRRIVTSWEILSDAKRRKSLDASPGATVSENSTSASRGGGTAYGPATGYGSGYKTVYRTNMHYTYDFDEMYRGPMNTGPLYMRNGTLALLIIAGTALVTFIIFGLVTARLDKLHRDLDDQDERLRAFYEDRKRRAIDRGPMESMRVIRERAMAEDVDRRDRLLSDGSHETASRQETPAASTR